MIDTTQFLVAVKRDDRLSLKAKGVALCIDLGPQTIRGIKQQTRSTVKDIRASLNELYKFGYLAHIEACLDDDSVLYDWYEAVRDDE